LFPPQRKNFCSNAPRFSSRAYFSQRLSKSNELQPHGSASSEWLKSHRTPPNFHLFFSPPPSLFVRSFVFEDCPFLKPWFPLFFRAAICSPFSPRQRGVGGALVRACCGVKVNFFENPAFVIRGRGCFSVHSIYSAPQFFFRVLFRLGFLRISLNGFFFHLLVPPP